MIIGVEPEERRGKEFYASNGCPERRVAMIWAICVAAGLSIILTGVVAFYDWVVK